MVQEQLLQIDERFEALNSGNLGFTDKKRFKINAALQVTNFGDILSQNTKRGQVGEMFEQYNFGEIVVAHFNKLDIFSSMFGYGAMLS
jgi:hypothetical protein